MLRRVASARAHRPCTCLLRCSIAGPDARAVETSCEAVGPTYVPTVLPTVRKEHCDGRYGRDVAMLTDLVRCTVVAQDLHQVTSHLGTHASTLSQGSPPVSWDPSECKIRAKKGGGPCAKGGPQSAWSHAWTRADLSHAGNHCLEIILGNEITAQVFYFYWCDCYV